MGTKKITYNDKVSIVPPGVRENQVWDLDMNEIKRVVNDNADELIAMLGLLNLKEDSGNKQNTLSADPTNTKYPSVTAVLEALKAVNINVDSQPVYLKKTNLKGQLEEIEAEFGSVARSIKTNIKNLYQTGLARTDIDSSVISLINSTTIRITDVNKVLFVNTINPDVNTQALDDYLQDFGTLDFSINDTNTPVDLNERAIYFLGINANGDRVYRTVRAYDLDICYLIRVAVANNNGVYSIITTDIPVMYFPDLAANPPSDRGRTVAANGKIEPSGEASISFKFSSFSMTKEAVNYRNNKLDPNYLSIPDSIGGQAGKFILGLPNFESLSVNIVDSTVINPKKWYLADGTVGSPDLADTKYQVYRVLITVDGKIIIQTKASTNANPQPGFNAIFDNVEDATKGLKSTNFPDLLHSGDAMPVGVFYMRAGAASNGSTMNDTNDFFYDPILASTSSSTVEATTHDSLSGKNDNPGFLHVTNTEKASWNSKEPAISTGYNGSYFADDKTWKALTTSAVVEGSRLYYTEARVSANVDVAAAKAKMHDKLTIISGSGLSLNEQELSLLYASETTNGALRVSDWINFNSKAPGIHTHTVSQITDFPTIPTVDQSIIDGSTNAVSGNAVFEEINILKKPNQILQQTDFILTGQDITFNSGWIWRINTIEYTNPSQVVINFPLATTGNSRLDLVVLTTSNTFLRVAGVESVANPVAPSLPNNTLEATIVVVTDGIVNQPQPPEVNGAYVQKSERANVVLTGSGVINQLNLVDEKATIVFKGSITRLNTISYASVPYNGKRITLFNAQATPVTISHSVSGYGVDFIFENGQDYVLAPNETIEFSFDITYAPYAHHMPIGRKSDSDSQIEIGTSQNVSSSWNKKTILFTANCTITVPATLLAQYGFVFRTLAGVTVTWTITAPFTWETTPTTTPEKTTGSFMRRGSTNTILLDF